MPWDDAMADLVGLDKSRTSLGLVEVNKHCLRREPEGPEQLLEGGWFVDFKLFWQLTNVYSLDSDLLTEVVERSGDDSECVSPLQGFLGGSHDLPLPKLVDVRAQCAPRLRLTSVIYSKT